MAKGLMQEKALILQVCILHMEGVREAHDRAGGADGLEAGGIAKWLPFCAHGLVGAVRHDAHRGSFWGALGSRFLAQFNGGIIWECELPGCCAVCGPCKAPRMHDTLKWIASQRLQTHAVSTPQHA